MAESGPQDAVASALRAAAQALEALADQDTPQTRKELHDAAEGLRLAPWESAANGDSSGVAGELTAFCRALAGAPPIADRVAAQQEILPADAELLTDICLLLAGFGVMLSSGAGSVIEEADAVRALCATAVPLTTVLRLLQRVPPGREGAVAALADAAVKGIGVLALCTQPLNADLPPRVLALLKSLHLKPAAVSSFLQAAVTAADAHVQAHGVFPFVYLPKILNAAFREGTRLEPCSEFVGTVRRQPSLLNQLVGWAASSYLAQSKTTAASFDAESACQFAALLASGCLQEALLAREGTAGSLAAQAAAVVGQPELGQGSTACREAELLAASLALLGQLMDSLIQTWQSSRSAMSAGLAQVLVSNLSTSLPVLARVAAAVAAAAPDGSQPCGEDGSSGSSGRLASWFFNDAATRMAWALALSSWAHAICSLAQASFSPMQLGAHAHFSKAAAVGVALLHLVLLLPGQPASGQQAGSSLTVGAAWAAEGGAAAVALRLCTGGLACLTLQGKVCALSSRAAEAAARLLAFSREGRVAFWDALGTAEAEAGLHAFSAACRYVHVVSADAAAGAADGKQRQGAPALMLMPDTRLRDMHVLLKDWLDACMFLLPRGNPAPPPELKRQRTDCTLLLLLSAVEALTAPAFEGQQPGSVRALCHNLQVLAPWVGLRENLEMLLEGSPVGTGAAAVLATVARQCLQSELSREGAILLAPEKGPVPTAMRLLDTIIGLNYAAVLHTVARDTPLLQALCQAARRLQQEHRAAGRQRRQGSQALLQYKKAWGLLRGAVGALTSDGSPLAALWPEQPVVEQQAAGRAFDALLAAAAAAVGAEGSPAIPAPQPSMEAAERLAVRCARALALRNCANPACPNLAASSPDVAGRRCGGCAVVRYCGRECCKADWKAHKLACTLLQCEAAEAAQAAEQAAGPA